MDAGPSRKRVVVIRRRLEYLRPAELRDAYLEVYGAEAASTVPDERVRESLYEAIDEILGAD